jgi:hypothetical protein
MGGQLLPVKHLHRICKPRLCEATLVSLLCFRVNVAFHCHVRDLTVLAPTYACRPPWQVTEWMLGSVTQCLSLAGHAHVVGSHHIVC